MRRPVVQWLLALLVTLASAYWQRVSGPTYAARGEVRLGEQVLAVRLARSHGGAGGLPVRIVAPDRAVEGAVVWRKHPSDAPWQSLSLMRDGDLLTVSLPHLPPAGKLEYQVRLRRGGERAAFPPRAAIARYRRQVSPVLLVPHIVAMFLAMLASTGAGVAALLGGEYRGAARAAGALLLVGGFVLGPSVQKQAFDAWWTGIPWGWDLTDNKTLVAGLVWVWALWRLRVGRAAKGAVVAAALTTLAVFVIPHSTWGSELRWD